MRVADYVVRKLAENGIDTVFGLTGGGIMHLVDAIALNGQVKFQPVHHEEFAGVCADGYARSGKRFGVAFGTTGPGAAHLFSACAAAWQDSVPVIFIVGQVKTSDSSKLLGLKVRQNGTFELDCVGSFSTITKKSTISSSASDAIFAIDEAIELCQAGRPGPVLLEIPLDVQGMKIPDGLESSYVSVNSTHVDSDKEERFRLKVKDLLSQAERPIVLVGSGVVRSNSHQQLREFCDRSGIPFVVTQFARELGRLENPLFLGSPGVKANKSANLGLSEADLIIAVGTSLHQQVVGWNARAFAELPSRKIWTEIDEDTLKARAHLVDYSFQIESLRSLELLQETLSEINLNRASLDRWRQRAMTLRERYLLHFPQHEEVSNRFCLYELVSALSARAERFRAVTTDAGLAWYAVPQHFFLSAGSSFISSGSFGAMGVGLPLAIGSATATQQPTLCITGDGSIMMCLQELATLSSSRLPILLVVNSNGGYLSIKSTHDKFFSGRKIGTDDSNGVFIPSIEELAKTFRIAYSKVRSVQELETLLDDDKCKNLREPLIIEAMIYEDQKIEPVLVSRLNPKTGQMESGGLQDLEPLDDKEETR